MAKGNGQKKADGSVLDFEAQLWAAARRPGAQAERNPFVA